MRYGADGELDIDDFIYRIEVDGHIYIGQSKRGHGNNKLGTGNRLTEHLTRAYSDKAPEPGSIYEFIHEERLQKIKITVYEAPDYGIPNISDAYTDFTTHWKTNPDDTGDSTTTTTDLIDFAEIYHIMHAVQSGEGDKLTNKSFGGQGRGYYYVGDNGKVSGARRAIMRSDSPQRAYNLFRLTDDTQVNMRKISEEIMNVLFDENWPSMADKLYGNNSDIKPEIDNLRKEPSWPEFYNDTITDLIPDLLSQVIVKIIKELKDLKDLPKAKAIFYSKYWNANMKADVSDKIKEPIKKFFERRDSLIKAISKYLAGQVGDSKDLDFNLSITDDEVSKILEDLVNYCGSAIMNSISGNIKKVFKDLANGDIDINDNGSSPSIKTTNFKIPVKTSLLYPSAAPKKAETQASWLVGGVVGGESVDLKPFSLQVFNRMYLRARRESNFFDNPIITQRPDDATNVKALTSFKATDHYLMRDVMGELTFNGIVSNIGTLHRMAGPVIAPLQAGMKIYAPFGENKRVALGRKIREEYKTCAPAYVNENWWKFYNPMVHWWKTHFKEGQSNWQTVVINNKGYCSRIPNPTTLYVYGRDIRTMSDKITIY